MKIDQQIQHPAVTPGNTQKIGFPDSAKEAPNADKSAFNISISKEAGQLLKVIELSASASTSEFEIRWGKVGAIREQLASGNYNISGKDVALKILNALKN